jgi:hypothetical protein
VEKQYRINRAILQGKNDFYEIEVKPHLVFDNTYGLDTDESDTKPKTLNASLIAACICPVSENLTRTVLHMAERLPDGEGIGYGHGPYRIMDGFATLEQAMDYLGYTLVDEFMTDLTPNQGTVFHVWPEGANEWFFTMNSDYAQSVYENGGSVIQYDRVPYVPGSSSSSGANEAETD